MVILFLFLQDLDRVKTGKCDCKIKETEQRKKREKKERQEKKRKEERRKTFYKVATIKMDSALLATIKTNYCKHCKDLEEERGKPQPKAAHSPAKCNFTLSGEMQLQVL